MSIKYYWHNKSSFLAFIYFYKSIFEILFEYYIQGIKNKAYI